MGTRGLLASGHYLASAAGMRIMEKGGNAVDAAAAMGFCLNIVEPHQNGFGGEVPILVHSAADKKVHAISGQGWSPSALTIDWCRSNNIDLIPGDGYIPACVPATVGTWAMALARFGTMTFSEILEPAIDLAENGFPMYKALHDFILGKYELFVGRYYSTAELYINDGVVPQVGTIIRNPDLAGVLRKICDAEQAASGVGRIAAIEAGRDAFYKGEIAERIVDFISSNPVLDASGTTHTGLLSTNDFAEWQAEVEEPLTYNYRGFDVYKCSSWTQGPVFLQQLALLQNYDLASMGQFSPDYLHTLIECGKLAFADREAYYGDPKFDVLPIDVLLSDEYNSARLELIDATASSELRPGDTGNGVPGYATFDVLQDNREYLGLSSGTDHYTNPTSKPGDTTQLAVADAEGNLVSATPSGGWIQSSPVIKGLGFALGTRGQMFYLNANRPNALAPQKRPRATLTPTIVTHDGLPLLAFGTPGGDAQDQWTLQFFLNMVEFDMDIQSALDAPLLKIEHMPLSFYPRIAHPGKVSMDTRFPDEVLNELERRGHLVNHGPMPVRMMAVMRDNINGTLHGGVCSSSPTGYALGF